MTLGLRTCDFFAKARMAFSFERCEKTEEQEFSTDGKRRAILRPSVIAQSLRAEIPT